MVKPVKELSIEEIKSVLKEAGLPRFRADQLLVWLYGKNASDYDEMTNLPKTMREQLRDTLPLYNPMIIEKLVSKDGSRKYLVEYHDGTSVETVGLPAEDGRLTVCCSSQAGCAMGCSFCATGRNGLKRNLYPGEIADQVAVVQQDFDQRVTNVVVMGQGEPFANYENTLAALKILNNEKLFNIGARHITVSTCGLISGIERFTQEPEQYTLAVSLHAALQEVRDSLMPAVRGQRLGDLRKALCNYAESTGRRFSLEYALMNGINDSEEDLAALCSFCKRLLCHVNLIPLNEIEESPYKPVSSAVMLHWKDELEKHGVAASVRKSRGSDIAGACGQLANKVLR